MAYSWHQHLVRQARDLDAMRKDLDSADFRGGVDWDGTIEARHTFGSPVEIERWALAEQFLTAWTDWWGLVNRWGRYFGQGQSAWSDSFWRIADRCGWRVNALLRDGDLRSRIRKAMTDAAGLDAAFEGPPEGSPDAAVADAVVHRLLANDTRLKIANLLDEQGGAPDPSASELLKGLDNAIAEELTSLEGDAAELALTHVRTYRHSMLRVSWLMGSGPKTQAGSEFIDRPRPESPIVPEPLLPTLQQAGERPTRVVRRASQAIVEVGYDAFADDVYSELMQGGGGSPLGAEGVAVLRPGSEPKPADIVVVVSRGDARRGAAGMAASLGALQRLLTREPHAVRFVLFLTDSWDTGVYESDENRPLREATAAGVRIAFLISPPPLVPEPFAIGFAGFGKLRGAPRSGTSASAPGAGGRSARQIDMD